MELPPGFRFHPTDEELITHYLSKKIADCDFSAIAVGEVDMNKVEPWDLPWRAKVGEKEWYFFCLKDKKYLTGSRTNRATSAGYWKVTGKDKEIFRGKTLLGTKKTLVFYHGRAPNGEKSNWVVHEYNMANYATQNNWVLSRVFQKTSRGKKVHIWELIGMHPSTHPPLLDPNPPYYNIKTKSMDAESGLVPCFSSPNIPSSHSFGKVLEESLVFRGMVGKTLNHGCKKEGEMASPTQETAFSTDNSNLDVENISSVGSLDLDTLWGY